MEHSLGCTGTDGYSRWFRVLPSGILIASIGLRDAGTVSIVCYERGSGWVVLEFGDAGKQVANLRLHASGRALRHCIAGDQLISLLTDYSLETRNLRTNEVRRYPGGVPVHGQPDMHPMPATNTTEEGVLIVDKAAAQVTRFSLRAGTSTVVRFESPEIAASRRMAESVVVERRSQNRHGGNASKDSPPVMAGSSAGLDGKLYFMLNPVRPGDRGVLVMRGDLSGIVDWRGSIPLVEDGGKRLRPLRLAVTERELFAIYPYGQVSVFRLPESY